MATPGEHPPPLSMPIAQEELDAIRTYQAQERTRRVEEYTKAHPEASDRLTEIYKFGIRTQSEYDLFKAATGEF